MSRLEQLADLIERGALTYGDRRDLAALLRAASAETVGTEWGSIQHTSEHNADLHAARLAIASAKAERDKALKKTAMTLGVGDGTGSLYVHGDYDSIKACQAKLLERETAFASLAEKRRAIDEAFKVLDSGHGMLACREAAHILRPHWQEGDTRDDLPPLPTERHAPLNLPADRTKMIERVCEADDGACSTGSTPATADDTRELVARLAEAIARYFDDGEETVINLINRVRDIENAARRGGGA